MTPIDFIQARSGATTMREFRVDRFILYPAHWTAYNNGTPLTWKRVRFTRANAARVPRNQAGVYTFTVEPDVAGHPACSYLLYVGKADRCSLQKRYRSYIDAPTAWKARPHIAAMVERWQAHLWFYFAPVSRKRLIKPLEDDLVTAFLPPENRAWPASIRKMMPLVFG